MKFKNLMLVMALVSTIVSHNAKADSENEDGTIVEDASAEIYFEHSGAPDSFCVVPIVEKDDLSPGRFTSTFDCFVGGDDPKKLYLSLDLPNQEELKEVKRVLYKFAYPEEESAVSFRTTINQIEKRNPSGQIIGIELADLTRMSKRFIRGDRFIFKISIQYINMEGSEKYLSVEMPMILK